MSPEDPAGATSVDVSLRPVESSEYELAVEATAQVQGSAGEELLRHRYEALPRHNDVVATGTPDANDALVDRPDAVHVHTRYYDGETEEYEGDAHETWRPDDPTVLSDPSAFRAAVRDHVLDSLPEREGSDGGREGSGDEMSTDDASPGDGD